jgi:pectinesterase
MRTLYNIFLLTLFVPMLACGGGRSLLVTVENPGDFERMRETIAVPLKDVRKELEGIDVSRLVVSYAETGASLLTQVTADELLFQSDFKPQERKEFIITQSEKSGTRNQSLVDGRFVLPREDYAWENDRIAFRMYGTALAGEVNNGIDVWTKRVRYLIVEKWYKESEGSPPDKNTYHEDRGEGADFFSVGRSLGAGGSGIWHNGKLYQPGVFSSQKTICNGPIRVAFELTYTNWNIDGKKFTELKRISLDAGQNLNRVDVMFMGLSPSDTLQIACGLVKRNNTTVLINEKDCWMSLWGLTNSDIVNGSLGTGVVLQASASVKFTEDKDQYLIIGNAMAGEPFTHFSGAGWTRSGDFQTADEWNTYLGTFSRRLQAPLKVSIAVKE